MLEVELGGGERNHAPLETPSAQAIDHEVADCLALGVDEESFEPANRLTVRVTDHRPEGRRALPDIVGSHITKRNVRHVRLLAHTLRKRDAMLPRLESSENARIWSRQTVQPLSVVRSLNGTVCRACKYF
jgi:hypothetical protein